MAETALKEHGYEPDPAVHEIFTKYVTTVNDGIFRAYTSNIRRARHAHTVTGLPDAYSRGRIIGVYARLALYGADYLMQEKLTTGMLLKKSTKKLSVFVKKLTFNTKHFKMSFALVIFTV